MMYIMLDGLCLVAKEEVLNCSSRNDYRDLRSLLFSGLFVLASIESAPRSYAVFIGQ